MNTEIKTISKENIKFSLWLMFIGIIFLTLTAFISPTRFWVSALLNSFNILTIGLFALLLLSIHYVAKMSWTSPFKFILRVKQSFLLIGSFFLLLSMFGMGYLYEWTHLDIVAKDPLLLHKQAYLNIQFFLIRMIVFLLLWNILNFIIKSNTFKYDQTGDLLILKKVTRSSAVFIVVFFITFSFASFDWLMTIEPHWFSTIYATYAFSGMFVNGFAVLTLITILLKKNGLFKDVINENHLHDLGKFMFGMSTFWAYIWFSQYLLIWYSNIPEETQYFVLRIKNGWEWAIYFNLIINWIIPFLILLPRNAKRNNKSLVVAATILVVGHWFDLHLMIAPKIFEHHKLKALITPMDVGILIGVIGFFIWMFLFLMKRTKYVQKSRDLYLEEGINLNQ